MPAGAFADNDNPCFGWVGYSADSKVSGAPVKGSLFDGEMPCDDSRTVYDQGIDVYYGGNKGFVKSDRSLCAFRGKYYRSRAFSHFSNNQCPHRRYPHIRLLRELRLFVQQCRRAHKAFQPRRERQDEDPYEAHRDFLRRCQRLSRHRVI